VICDPISDSETDEQSDKSNNSCENNLRSHSQDTGVGPDLQRLSDVIISKETHPTSEAFEFLKEQSECKSLEHVWKLAKQGSQQYIIENGVLYESTPSWIKSDHDRLLVCPLKFLP
jgi:hypothetical protein